jgi:nicotinate-nucleotide adenylyltransferase
MSQAMGILGGTFDPIHLGHVAMAQQVLATCSLSQVLFMPNNVSADKFSVVATAAQRLEMVRLSLSSEDNMSTSDLELQRPGKSYAVDTLRLLRQQYPATPLVFIIGSDAFSHITSWYQYQELFSLCHFVVVNRDGGEFEKMNLPEGLTSRLTTELDSLQQQLAGKIYFQTIQPITISATEVRQHLRTGDDLSAYLNPKVIDYIASHKLY